MTNQIREDLPELKPSEKKKSRQDETVYTLTFAGTYSATTPDGPVQKAYTIEGVKIKHETINKESNWSAKAEFKHNIGPVLMAKKYPDFENFRTYHIVSATSDNDRALAGNLSLQTYEQLVNYIETNELDVNPDLYEDDDALRTAIEDYQKDPDGYTKNEKHLLSVRGPRIQRKHESIALNKDWTPDNKEPDSVAKKELEKLKDDKKDNKKPDLG